MKLRSPRRTATRVRFVWHDLPAPDPRRTRCPPRGPRARRASRRATTASGRCTTRSSRSSTARSSRAGSRARTSTATRARSASTWPSGRSGARRGRAPGRASTRDAAAADKLGFNGTPAFVIVPAGAKTGLRRRRRAALRKFRRLIDRALAEASGASEVKSALRRRARAPRRSRRPRSARAVEGEHHLGVDVGGGLLVVAGRSPNAPSAAFMAHYTLRPERRVQPDGRGAVLARRARADLRRQEGARSPSPTTIANGDVGLGYVFDVLRGCPYAGLLVGGYDLSGGTLPSSKILPGAELALGLDYRLDRTSSLGIAARQHFLSESATYPSFTQLFSRAEYVWERGTLDAARGVGGARRSGLVLQPEAVVQRAHGELRVLRRDEAAHADLARGDRLDVDALVRQDAGTSSRRCPRASACRGRRWRPSRRPRRSGPRARRRPWRSPRSSAFARARSVFASVNVMAARGSASVVAFWTIMSTEMFFSAIFSKSSAAMPGRSSTPTTCTRASPLSYATPLTTTPSSARIFFGHDRPRLVVERAADVDGHAVLHARFPRCESGAPSRRATRARASLRTRCGRSCARTGRCSGRSCRRRRRPCRSRTRRR